MFPGEQPSLQELLPEDALKLLPTLSDEENGILYFLVLFGHIAMLPPPEASIADGKSSPLEAEEQEQVCHSCPFSDAFDASFPFAEAGFSKRSSLSRFKYKTCFCCHCFAIYSLVWSRWNVSCNRDVISKILDYIESPPESTLEITQGTLESTPQGIVSQGSKGTGCSPQGGILQGSKGKKKKKSDKKRGISQKKVDEDQSSYSETALVSEYPCPLGSTHTTCDSGQEVCITMESGPIITSEIVTAGHKKSFLRGLKQKQKHKPVISLNTENAISPVVSTSKSLTGAASIEIPENLIHGLSPSSSVSQGKNITKLQKPRRPGKRRSSQIIPVDCEDREQEANIVLENTQTSLIPRAADAGLGGRGFLSRVFPDALGRVASRLWDLVSVRLRSRSVEYH